jgi:hypothetical protein
LGVWLGNIIFSSLSKNHALVNKEEEKKKVRISPTGFIHYAVCRNVTEEKKHRSASGVFGKVPRLRCTVGTVLHNARDFCGFFARLAAGQLDSSILGSLRKF